MTSGSLRCRSGRMAHRHAAKPKRAIRMRCKTPRRARESRFYDPIVRSFWASRHCDQRRRCASAMRARPSGVFGPVLSPPWSLQRVFSCTTRARHGVPFRVNAPHLGHRLRRAPRERRYHGGSPYTRCSQAMTSFASSVWVTSLHLGVAAGLPIIRYFRPI